MQILIRLSGLAWRYPWKLIIAYVCLIAATLFSLAVPKLLGSAVDNALTSRQFASLLLLAGIILLTSALRGAFTFGQNYVSEMLSQKVAYDLRNAIYNKLQHMSFAFHDQQHTGNLMSKATADVEAVRFFVSQGLIRLVQLVLLVGGATALMVTTNWRLAIIGMAFLPFIAWRTATIRLEFQRIWRRIQNSLGDLTTILQENLTGTRVVRAFGAEEFERSKFNKQSQEVADLSIEANRLQAASTSQMTLMFAVGMGFLVWFGGREIVAGRLTPGELTQFIFFQSMLAMPVRITGMVVNIISRAHGAGIRLFETLDANSPVQEKPGATVLGRVKGHVRFENISFAYRAGLSEVLTDITFEAKPGQVIALLGAPGSGKTTVVHLVPRFYDPTVGRLTVDGIDVRDVTLDSLRRNVGIVMQDVFVFTATLRQNIAYGFPEATDEQVVRASKIAQMDEFVSSLPKGYDTWVGERGVTLSGGQRQRLAIARSVLLDPPILILDDTTSSVDAETEHRLKEALAEVMRDRTTFVIAHRLSTVLSADMILVMDRGKILERGTHQELLALGGMYRQIYELQLLPDGEVAAAGAVSNGARPAGIQGRPAWAGGGPGRGMGGGGRGPGGPGRGMGGGR